MDLLFHQNARLYSDAFRNSLPVGLVDSRHVSFFSSLNRALLASAVYRRILNHNGLPIHYGNIGHYTAHLSSSAYLDGFV